MLSKEIFPEKRKRKNTFSRFYSRSLKNGLSSSLCLCCRHTRYLSIGKLSHFSEIPAPGGSMRQKRAQFFCVCNLFSPFFPCPFLKVQSGIGQYIRPRWSCFLLFLSSQKECESPLNGVAQIQCESGKMLKNRSNEKGLDDEATVNV